MNMLFIQQADNGYSRRGHFGDSVVYNMLLIYSSTSMVQEQRSLVSQSRC